jgi:hypothetical protein
LKKITLQLIPIIKKLIKKKEWQGNLPFEQLIKTVTPKLAMYIGSWGFYSGTKLYVPVLP